MTEPSRGLGDTLAKLTKAVGIQPCEGCNKRIDWMNEWFPYSRQSMLTPDKETTTPDGPEQYGYILSNGTVLTPQGAVNRLIVTKFRFRAMKDGTNPIETPNSRTNLAIGPAARPRTAAPTADNVGKDVAEDAALTGIETVLAALFRAKDQ